MHMIYIAVWTILGVVPNMMLFITICTYFFVSANHYVAHPDVSQNEIFYTIAVYIPCAFILGILIKEYLWDSIMYLHSDEIKAWCEDHANVCADYNLLNKVETIDSDEIPEFYWDVAF